MSASRFGRVQKASALVPLMVLSTAWTASVTGIGLTSAAAGDTEPPAVLPDGTEIPTEAIRAPATVSAPGVTAPGIEGKRAEKVVATASANGIPSAALAAYQRAETVINSADKGCNITWQLIAAIGRVESDHGRANGNTLGKDGVARPGIFGIPLDGRRGTAVISDTDAGQYDADAEWDRAVGPMQFIPSTWSVVGVDADGDAKRDPQDIDDAALASAVYLCSGNDDLSTVAGQRAAVYRYNHSESYVDLVLSIMNAYLSGDFTSVPNSATPAGVFLPAPTPVAPAAPKGPRNDDRNGPDNGGNNGGNNDNPPANQPPKDDDDPKDPVQPPGDGDGNPVPTTPPLPDPSLPPVEDVLTTAEAIAECTAQGLVDNPLKDNDDFDKCVEDLTNP
ncbi:lytic transglycosylase domain-containing protein [Nocardioides sp. GCM10027113]|uniref:lytic transglycosylase domain-containing protein n=1 Tax=unclassified Nocardioides TaxID=2615069 RepID=UPI00360AA53B